MDRLTVLLIMIAIILIGCTERGSLTNETPSPTEANPTDQTMPNDMPNDFGFSVSFGFGKKDKINTFEGTVTKDLIEDGTVTADIELTNQEMLEIYEKMKEIRVTNRKQFVPESKDGDTCQQDPHGKDKWKITFDGETISHNISGKYCEPTEDAKQFFELRELVFSKVKNKDEYLELPEPNGGYD